MESSQESAVTGAPVAGGSAALASPAGPSAHTGALERAAPWRQRIAGLLILLLIALAGYGLSRLNELGRPAVRTLTFSGPGGQSILVTFEEAPRATGLPVREVRWILSRLPVELEPRRSLLRIDGRMERVVPPGWPVTLVHPDGRLSRRDLGFDGERTAALVESLARRSSPPRPSPRCAGPSRRWIPGSAASGSAHHRLGAALSGPPWPALCAASSFHVCAHASRAGPQKEMPTAIDRRPCCLTRIVSSKPQNEAPPSAAAGGVGRPSPRADGGGRS